MTTILIALVISSLSLVVLLQTNILSKKYNFIDNPALEIKKIHKIPISNIGGLACLIPFLLSVTISPFIEEYFSKKYLLIIFFSSILYFFLGRYDDLKNVAPNIKFLCFIFIFLFLYPFEPYLIINNLNFKYFDWTIDLGNYGIFFTLFCMFLFFNASNFIDGVNGLYASTIIFWVLSLFFLAKSFSIIFFVIIFALLIFLIFNLNNKVFFGNSGNTFLTCFIGSSYIYTYNNYSNIYCDEIFILFLIPGLDAARLTFERLFKGKSPLQGDNRHLHHLILSVSNKKIVWLINLLIIILPFICLKITENFKYSFAIAFIIYAVLIFILPKKFKFY